MGRNVAQKLIASHLADGEMTAGSEIGLRIDQTLTQDATGTMVMLELEALGLDRVRTQVSVQYADHNLLQTDERNMADHLFLRSACQRFGVWYSRPGNGVSHPVHMERFGRPGASLAGSDSHTCAAGSLGMLAIGVGGLEVAMAMAGQPLYVTMPQIWGVRLTGDRHVIANMGAELGATTSVFPADEQARAFLSREGRGSDFTEVTADPDASYDVTDEIDLGRLEPLIARPSSPGNVVPVREVAGEPVYQGVVGSSANPGLRDFAMVAAITADRSAHSQVSMDVNPTSRQILADLTAMGATLSLIRSGARIHQAGCMGRIGMGQAPAIGRNSLRTVPRNFPGRSGTDEDSVWLCSPERPRPPR
jgi:aconitase A